jgi:hypothetical protein
MSKTIKLVMAGLAAIVVVTVIAVTALPHGSTNTPSTGTTNPSTPTTASGPSQQAFTAKMETLSKTDNKLSAELTAQGFTNGTTIPIYAPTAKTASAYSAVAPKMLQGEYLAAPLMTESLAASLLVPSAYIAKMQQVPLTLVPVNAAIPWQAVQVTYSSGNTAATVVTMMEASEYHSGTLVGKGLYAAVKVSLVNGSTGWKVSAVSAYTATQAQSLYQQYGQNYKP